MRMLAIIAVLAGCATEPPPPPKAPAKPAEPSEPTGMPVGYNEVRPLQVVDLGDGGAILLVDPTGERVLPIFIGGTEAASIDVRMRNDKAPRPLTHDLLDALLARLHASLVKVQVDELRNGVFIGSIFVRANGRVFRVDARPSDAIALAIGNHVPIYVAKQVMDEAGMRRDELKKQQNQTPTIQS
jgi:bifunctional DNase/RNase